MSATNTQKTQLLFHIRSGSIFVTYTKGELRFTENKFMRMGRVSSTREYINEMQITLDELTNTVVMHISKESLDIPRSIGIVYTSPWIMTQIKNFHEEYSFPHSHTAFSEEILEGEEFNKTIFSFKEEGVFLCDTSILGVYMNGYAVGTAPKGDLLCTKFDAAYAVATVDSHIRTAVENCLKKHLSNREFRHIPLVTWLQAELAASKPHYTGVICYIGCELSEAYIVVDGIITQQVDIRTGTHSLLTNPYLQMTIDFNTFMSVYDETLEETEPYIKNKVLVVSEDPSLSLFFLENFIRMGFKASELRIY